MAEKLLYEFAIILQEQVDKQTGAVTEEAKLIDRGEVLAADNEQATILVSRKIPEEHVGHLERITLAVRPF